MIRPADDSPFPSHPWDLTPAAARTLQQQLSGLVCRQDDLPPLRCVAGIDVGYEQGGRISRAAVALLSFPGLQPLSKAVARRPACFPYMPGLLSFREVPVMLDALEQLPSLPDLLLCDGQGIAHPRRFGIACHLGVLTDLPTIGVAKSRLTGVHDPLPSEKGAWVELRDGEELIGAVLRSRAGVKPLYVSIGHRISLPTAVRLTLACITRYRLPETTRQAHLLASTAAGQSL